MSLMLIEDDLAIASMLSTALTVEGYTVHHATTLAQARALWAAQPASAVLLDLSLPDGDGVQWLKEFRTQFKQPVLVLSARGDEADKVKALDGGADDYVTKPYALPELLARIRVALRRVSAAQPGPRLVEFGDVRINLDSFELSRQGARLHLTAKEWRVLAALADAPGRLVRQRELMTQVWGPEYADDVHYLRIIMSKLRAKLEADPAQPRHLITEPGLGYRLLVQ